MGPRAHGALSPGLGSVPRGRVRAPGSGAQQEGAARLTGAAPAPNRDAYRSSAGGVRLLSTFSVRSSSPHTT
ncbi:hypothetical protein Sm713_58920 [Streptomyces sp. TS71-3]|nr:hypothetical protein Sm713_58920 [Streptomyces sp. TS71-3]